MAWIDSYCSEIHGLEVQCFAAYQSPGPFKITNNYMSSTGEEVIFGGAGVYVVYLMADIEVKRNWFKNDPAWQSCGTGGTVDWCQYLESGYQCPGLDGNGNPCNGGNASSPHRQWTVKNNFEFKAAIRAIVDGNIMENNWTAGQTGVSTLITVRQGGLLAFPLVVDDINFTNNVLKNVEAGFNTLAQDNNCEHTPPYYSCNYLGESKRVAFSNNLILLSNTLDPTAFQFGILLNSGDSTLVPIPTTGVDSYVFQHNTTIRQARTQVTPTSP